MLAQFCFYPQNDHWINGQKLPKQHHSFQMSLLFPKYELLMLFFKVASNLLINLQDVNYDQKLQVNIIGNILALAASSLLTPL